MVNTWHKKPLSSFPAEAESPRGAVLRLILGYKERLVNVRGDLVCGHNRFYKAPEIVTEGKPWRHPTCRYKSKVEAKTVVEQDLLSLAAKLPFHDWLSFVIRLPRHPLSLVPSLADSEGTDQVTGEVERLLAALALGEPTREALIKAKVNHALITG